MRGWFWIGFLWFLASSACASVERQDTTADGGAVEVVDVTVENDLQPPTAVTVFIRDQVGTRRTLGDVGPLDTRTFSFDPPTASGSYRLVARTTTGEEIQSDRITVFEGEGVRWRLTGNIIM